MQDDEKMFKIGLFMVCVVVALIMFLQVGYREQNRVLTNLHDEVSTAHKNIEKAQNIFTERTRPDLLKNTVFKVNPDAETVSFSKNIHIDEIPMVEK